MVPISSVVLVLLILCLQCDRVHMYRYIPKSMRSRELPVTLERMYQTRHRVTSTKLAVVAPLSQLVSKVSPGRLSSVLGRSPGAALVAMRSALLVFERLLTWVRTSFASVVTALRKKDKKVSSDLVSEKQEQDAALSGDIAPRVTDATTERAAERSDLVSEKQEQELALPGDVTPRVTDTTTEGAAEQPDLEVERKKSTKQPEVLVPVYSQLEPSTRFAATGEMPKEKAIRVRDVPIVALSGKEDAISDNEAKTIAKSIADLYTNEYKF
jgi:hypothetical protein